MGNLQIILDFITDIAYKETEFKWLNDQNNKTLFDSSKFQEYTEQVSE